MKQFYYILFLILFLGCKSTKEVKNNKLDIVSTKKESSVIVIQTKDVDLDLSEISFISADITKPIIISDEKGNVKTLENVKSGKITAKKETKSENKVEEKKELEETLIDKSVIKEEAKSVSDTNNFKWIFIAIAFIVGLALIGYLAYKFKK